MSCSIKTSLVSFGLSPSSSASIFDNPTSILSRFLFSGASGCPFWALCSSTGYSRSTSRIHPRFALSFLARIFFFRRRHSLPCKIFFGRWFTYGATVKVVRVKILLVLSSSCLACSVHIRVVALCVSLAHHWYPTACSLFYEIDACPHLLAVPASLLSFSEEHPRISTAMWSSARGPGNTVSSKDFWSFQNIPQQTNIRLEVQIVIISQNFARKRCPYLVRTFWLFLRYVLVV